MRRCIAPASIMLIALAGVAPGASAQAYPAKPVRIIVGFPSGGVTDIVARIIGQKLSENLGQQFVVDNRPGGGSVIASEITAKAAPDGYTLSLISTSFAINTGFYKTLPYDPIKDFAAVILASSAPQVLVANLSLPVKSVADLVNLARAKPGQLNFASSGTSSTSHLAGELLKSLANIDLTHIPYKGGAAVMMPDVISGRVQLSFLSLPGTLPQIRAGKVRAIAVTSTKRSAAAPDIPTFAEAGIAGYEAASWSGLAAPAATPKTIVARINAEALRALRSPDVIAAIERQGADTLGSSAAEFEAYLKAEIAKWKKLIVALGAQLDRFQ
ncbi:MAG: tripartite tricarboxylate transporter substrate binding protein [Burkholderiales bacterium]|nr:tripartite tricarboxylate transporter substrate binding protein [Burkholderiales bacterium]